MHTHWVHILLRAKGHRGVDWLGGWEKVTLLYWGFEKKHLPKETDRNEKCEARGGFCIFKEKQYGCIRGEGLEKYVSRQRGTFLSLNISENMHVQSFKSKFIVLLHHNSTCTTGVYCMSGDTCNKNWDLTWGDNQNIIISFSFWCMGVKKKDFNWLKSTCNKGVSVRSPLSVNTSALMYCPFQGSSSKLFGLSNLSLFLFFLLL